MAIIPLINNRNLLDAALPFGKPPRLLRTMTHGFMPLWLLLTTPLAAALDEAAETPPSGDPFHIQPPPASSTAPPPDPPSDPSPHPPAGDTPVATAPLELNIIPLHHAEAEEMAELLLASGVLSAAGSANTDKRTNTLVVHDRPANLEAAAELIAQLDQQTLQVMIEARIVLASGDYTLELGKRLGLQWHDSSAQLRGSTYGLSNLSGEDSQDGLLIDMPVIDSGAQLGFAVGKIGRQLLQFELSAMEAEGYGQIVSSPRVLTTARREARIEQGVQIPYQQSTESGATTVAFRDAALSLTATPYVSSDGSIYLELEVTKDAVGQIFSGVPSIDTQAVATHMRVNDGETVILGGVREQERHEEHRRVPWLADIPLLGRLFRTRSERSRNQELLIFVTPQVVTSPGELTSGIRSAPQAETGGGAPQ